MNFQIEVMARTIWGEARSEDSMGKEAVAHVILNRSYGGSSIAEVCLAPKQFSCWNHKDPNYRKLIEVTEASSSYRSCLAAAFSVLSLEPKLDPTRGATHYHARSMKKKPYWARGLEPCYETRGHLFYNNVG